MSQNNHLFRVWIPASFIGQNGGGVEEVKAVYTPTTNAREDEIEQFYEDLQDLVELTPKNLFHHKRLECKSRKSRYTWSNRQVWPWCTK